MASRSAATSIRHSPGWSSAADLKALADDGLRWLNRHGSFRPHVCGQRLTLADIFLFCFLDFARQHGQPLSPEHGNIARWFDGICDRLAARAAPEQAAGER